MLISGLGVLFHQTVLATTPTLWALLVGFLLVGLPSSLVAERMLAPKSNSKGS